MQPEPIAVLVTEQTYVELLPEDFESGDTLEEVAKAKLQKLYREGKSLDTNFAGVEIVKAREVAA